jgi:hypothetical protein
LPLQIQSMQHCFRPNEPEDFHPISSGPCQAHTRRLQATARLRPCSMPAVLIARCLSRSVGERGCSQPMSNPLQHIGYWDNRFRKGRFRWPLFATGEFRRFPSPVDLVNPAWHSEDRHRLVAYLEAGRELIYWHGCSSCRFRCGIPDSQMGCRELTDGTWAWPEGLSHYVAEHYVMLPEEFAAHVIQNGYNCPSSLVVPRTEKGQALLEMGLWITWARHAKMVQRTQASLFAWKRTPMPSAAASRRSP